MLRLVPNDPCKDAAACVAGASVATPGVATVGPDLTLDVAMGDWDELLNAVKCRLTLIGGEWLLDTPEPLLFETLTRSRTSVLECVSALEQLHTTLAHELGRRRELEARIADMQAALDTLRRC